jgi:prepilin-type processing-associated H-X9-DG protein
MLNEVTGSATGLTAEQTQDGNSQYDNGVTSQYEGGYDTGYMSGVFTDTGYAPSLALNLDSVNPNGRHTNGSEFLFVDGHVKWLTGASVSAGFSADTSTTASPGSTSQEADGTSALHPGVAATFSII